MLEDLGPSMAFSSFSLGMLTEPTPARIRGRLFEVGSAQLHFIFTLSSYSFISVLLWDLVCEATTQRCVAPAGTGGAGGIKCSLGMKPGVMAKREKGGKYTPSGDFSVNGPL